MLMYLLRILQLADMRLEERVDVAYSCGGTHEITTPENFWPMESSRIMPKCMRRFPEQRFGSQCSRSQQAALKGGLCDVGSPSESGWA